MDAMAELLKLVAELLMLVDAVAELRPLLLMLASVLLKRLTASSIDGEASAEGAAAGVAVHCQCSASRARCS